MPVSHSLDFSPAVLPDFPPWFRALGSRLPRQWAALPHAALIVRLTRIYGMNEIEGMGEIGLRMRGRWQSGWLARGPEAACRCRKIYGACRGRPDRGVLRSQGGFIRGPAISSRAHGGGARRELANLEGLWRRRAREEAVALPARPCVVAGVTRAEREQRRYCPGRAVFLSYCFLLNRRKYSATESW